MSKLFISFWQNISHFIYPVVCEGCGKTLVAQEELLCIECIALLPFTNYHHILKNETTLRFEGRFPFERATSLAYYTKDALLQHLLHQFKYRDNKAVGRYFGKSLGWALSKTEWIKDVDIIVPVPLHNQKSRLRGYNQSEIIAQQLGAYLGLEVNKHTLIRLRNTDTQTHKTREERAENMKDAFGIVTAEPFRHKHILLLDDVLTTGATLESCTRVLLQIEGVKVSIATIGIAIN